MQDWYTTFVTKCIFPLYSALHLVNCSLYLTGFFLYLSKLLFDYSLPLVIFTILLFLYLYFSSFFPLFKPSFDYFLPPSTNYYTTLSNGANIFPLNSNPHLTSFSLYHFLLYLSNAASIFTYYSVLHFFHPLCSPFILKGLVYLLPFYHVPLLSLFFIFLFHLHRFSSSFPPLLFTPFLWLLYSLLLSLFWLLYFLLYSLSDSFTLFHSLLWLLRSLLHSLSDSFVLQGLVYLLFMRSTHLSLRLFLPHLHSFTLALTSLFCKV